MLVNSFLFASHPHVHIFNWRLLSRAYICERFFIVLQKNKCWDSTCSFIHSSHHRPQLIQVHFIIFIKLISPWLDFVSWINICVTYTHTHIHTYTQNKLYGMRSKEECEVKSKVFGVWSHNCTLYVALYIS